MSSLRAEVFIAGRPIYDASMAVRRERDLLLHYVSCATGDGGVMSKSPGHQKWPEHKVLESRVGERVTVELDGQLLADSRDVIRVDEDGSPARYYFPRGDVRMEKLEPTATTSQCPFKGTAHYFSLPMKSGGHVGKLDDAAWSYEEPFDEHQTLKDRLAFYDDKYRNIHVRVA